MEIKTKNKFTTFIKNYGTILISSFLIVAIAIALLVVGLSPAPAEVQLQEEVIPPIQQEEDIKVPVTTEPVVTYSLPMNNASIIKDYSIKELQYNQTLNRWEAHLSVDLMSLDTEVMAICDGKVTSVENDYLMGNVITITHDSGLVSVYASLSDDVMVKVGDEVKGGQVIATAGNTASSESADGVHLDFSMLLNGEEVDPNDYLSLQNK